MQLGLTLLLFAEIFLILVNWEDDGFGYDVKN